MKRRLKPYAFVLLCAALVCGFAAAGAETSLRAWGGWDGMLFSGRWNPLLVEITAGDAPIDGVMDVDIGASSGIVDRFRQPVSVPAGETRMYRLPVRLLVNQRTFEVRLSCDGETFTTTARTTGAVPENALIIGVLDKEMTQLAQALDEVEQYNVHGEREVIKAVILDTGSFALDDREISAFDALVVTEEQTLGSEDAERLERWQRTGGILVRMSSVDLSMCTQESAAQQIMCEIKAAQKAGHRIIREASNYPYSTALNSVMAAGRPGSLAPAVVLTVYVLAAGIGAYLLMKRMDRSRMLWAIIPAMAMIVCGVMALLGAELQMNQPMSSSVHVVRYDAAGSADVNELVRLTYAGQARRLVSTQDGLPIESMAYSYFQPYSNMDEEAELRHVITLGEQPSIELEDQADWLVRSLVVKNDAAPEGSVKAFAHMEKDGLHVEAENNTDVTIENAVLLTKVGYALLGDLAPGAAAQTVLMRTGEATLNDKGQIVIREQQLLPYSESMYAIVQSAVDPESVQDKDWKRSSLPAEEQMNRRLKECVLEMGASAAKQEGISCVLIGETPQLACQGLLLDGEPVARRAEKSVLICEAAFEPVSPSGYFYYPEGSFKHLEAMLDEHGVPLLGKEREAGYVFEQDEVLLGFSLGGVDLAGIEEIRLYAEGGVNLGSNEQEIVVEAYDYTCSEWVLLEENHDIRISGELVRRVVSMSGEVCLRFTCDRLSDCGVRLPNIIVEGCLSGQQRGGEAA